MVTSKILPLLSEAESELVRVERKIMEEKETLDVMTSLKEETREIEMIEIFRQLKICGKNC